MPTPIDRRRFLKSAVPAVTFGATGLYGTLIEPFQVVVERRVVRVPTLSPGLEGLRIVAMSDFHLEPYTKLPHIQAAVAAASALNPDLVFLLGDFVDSQLDAIDRLAPALAAVRSRLGVFAVLGNHDFWNGGHVTAILKGSGISVLRNRGVEVPVGRDSVFVAGVDSAWRARPDLRLAMEGYVGKAPVVLLAHEPDYADTAAADSRISLQLSGHSHGGQIRLPGIGALRLPTWGKRYDHGLYRVREMNLYTTRGIGVVGVPVRINCPPEVTEITLTA